jgi:hypothetical protein
MSKHQWLVRPSSMGNLMSKGRNGNDFGETAMKVIHEAVLLHKYGIETDHKPTPSMEKGIFNEAPNIDIAARVLGWLDVNSSQEKIRIANDFFIGEPDINTSILADIKSSWSAATFPFFENPKSKQYECQLNAYMDLTGKQEAELVYVLSNHPQHIIGSEIRRLTYYYADRPHLFQFQDGTIEELWSLAEEKATEVVMKEGVYDHIPEEKRVKRFIIKRDNELIDKMHDRVEQARNIFDQLIETI